ncbi:hypothetical protein AIOL_004071 [Candidatus Rhodobacter oscarellae]|uniref:Uncharacterized protein n=1 Tax=Candidatus Rhodobacter oscarellae TaxID=1675527 RepID=A0A0J9E8J7_9RHOB|nr:hypothetical protein [Candidatus Rhodobacter lobularis]KMW59090.1 hypothetical protein AIOL_004071 [Candidatus Rhodobacter lobularis]
MKHFIAIVLAMAPMAVHAGESFQATNTYVTESKAWPVDQATGYWMVAFEGVSQVTEGPIDTMRVECHGAGFWGPGGLDGGGICIHGEGDDTFILRFDSKPDGNTWTILSGTGKYQGLTGSGTAVTEALAGNRRISELVGDVSLGN